MSNEGAATAVGHTLDRGRASDQRTLARQHSRPRAFSTRDAKERVVPSPILLTLPPYCSLHHDAKRRMQLPILLNQLIPHPSVPPYSANRQDGGEPGPRSVRSSANRHDQDGHGIGTHTNVDFNNGNDTSQIVNRSSANRHDQYDHGVGTHTNVDFNNGNDTSQIDNRPSGCTGVTPTCLLYTSPSPRDQRGSRMPSSA